MKLGARQIGKSSIIYILGDFFSKGASFLLLPLYTRHLTQTEVGTVYLLQSVTAALGLLFSFGLAGAVKRFYVEFEDRREAEEYVASLWWFRLVCSGIVCAALVFLLLFVGQNVFGDVLPLHIVLAVVAAYTRSSFDIPLGRFIIREEPLKHRTFSFFQFLTTTGLIIYLVAVRHLGVGGVLWGQVGSHALWMVVSGVIVSRRSTPRFDWTNLNRGFRYSLPLVPHRLFQWGVSLSDRMILQSFAPLASVGLYGVGHQLGAVLSVFVTAINSAWMPRFFKTAERDDGSASYARLTTYFAVVVLGLALGLILLGPELLAVVATDSYGDSIVVLRLVAVGYVFHAGYLVNVNPLFYSKRTKFIPVVTGLAALANVGFNLALVPRHGIVAAACGAVVGYMVMSGAAYAISKRFYPIEYEYDRILLAGLVFSAAAGLGLVLPLQDAPLHVRVIVKSAMIAMYPLSLALLPGFLLGAEWQAARGVLRDFRHQLLMVVGHVE